MVRTLEVVEVSPSVEAALAVGQVGVFTSLEQFRLEGPVEALELAEGLGWYGLLWTTLTPSCTSQTVSEVKGW